MKQIAIYNPYLDTKGGGERVCLGLAQSLHQDLGHEVHLISHNPVDLQDLGSYFKLDLSGIKVVLVDFDTPFMRGLSHLPIPGRIRNIISDKKVSRAIKKGGYDAFINNCYQSNLPSPTKIGAYMCMFPQRLDTYPPDSSIVKKIYIQVARALQRLALHPFHRSPLDTYQLITANSTYTQGYVSKYWRRDSSVLYPLCESMQVEPPIKKEKLIFSVGRFFENIGENHHKRHDFLLDSFAKMTDLHQQGWRLCLAGSVAEDAGTLKYILKLIHDARDLPVDFRFNCSFQEIRTLFNQAQVYWHATGYGSDPTKHPERQEHFGITTVEAMSTGAIPVVINRAGQLESVTQAENGFLWDTDEELIGYTRKIAELSDAERNKLANKAKSKSKDYDLPAFRQNVREIFTNFLA